MTLPRKIERQPRFNMAKRIRSPGHLAWIREHGCCVPSCGGMPIEAAHVRTGTQAGVGIKPDDCWAISLCSDHHRMQHQIGERAFEIKHGIDMKALAREFASKSPHKAKFNRP
jgi:hypothetical protein